jgi:hypothetical protein
VGGTSGSTSATKGGLKGAAASGTEKFARAHSCTAEATPAKTVAVYEDALAPQSFPRPAMVALRHSDDVLALDGEDAPDAAQSTKTVTSVVYVAETLSLRTATHSASDETPPSRRLWPPAVALPAAIVEARCVVMTEEELETYVLLVTTPTTRTEDRGWPDKEDVDARRAVARPAASASKTAPDTPGMRRLAMTPYREAPSVGEEGEADEEPERPSPTARPKMRATAAQQSPAAARARLRRRRCSSWLILFFSMSSPPATRSAGAVSPGERSVSSPAAAAPWVVVVVVVASGAAAVRRVTRPPALMLTTTGVALLSGCIFVNVRTGREVWKMAQDSAKCENMCVKFLEFDPL